MADKIDTQSLLPRAAPGPDAPRPRNCGSFSAFTIHADEEQLSPAFIRKAGRSQDGGLDGVGGAAM